MPATRRFFLSTPPVAPDAGFADAPSSIADLGARPTLENHAAHRLMYAPLPGEASQIVAMGYDAWVQQQLSPETIDDSAAEAIFASLPRATYSETWAQLYDRRSHPTYAEAIRPLTEVRHRMWAGIVHSKRQLLERMVHFWHDHFSIYGYDFIVRSMFTKWDLTIRQHALGNFRAFLEATTVHPCMLYYLDNYLSTNAGPNENYARELYELHTMGAMNYQVPGGYIDQDVYESSRCFTGWTFETDGALANRGQFKYEADDHDRFIKLVLGNIIPGDQAAMKDGRDVLDMLAYHPGTARHIATKLCRRFVSESPSDAIVTSTADVFHANRMQPDQIRRTLEHVFSSEEFKDSRLMKFRSPVFWTASLMRRLGMSYTTSDTFNYLFERMGNGWFAWRPPDGPPDTSEYWATSANLLARWNFIFEIVSGWYTDSGIPIPTTGLAPATHVTPRAIADWWSTRIIGRAPSSTSLNQITQFVADGRNPDLPLPADEIAVKNQYTAALCAMSPEFMRH